MGLFSSRGLDYSRGDGSLARMKPNRYLAHHLPGETIPGAMDFDLLSEESKNGKHNQLLKKAVEFAGSLDYLAADYNYNSQEAHTPLASNQNVRVTDDLNSMMEFTANMVKKSIDNSANIYEELLPYLQEFENRLKLSLNVDQRKDLMCIFRVGMGLSLIENLSGQGLDGFCHPSIHNILHLPRQVWIEIQNHGYACDLSFLGGNDVQMRYIGLGLYSGYFQSKYTAESPSSTFERLAL
jgi:hypothetical protein